MKYPSYMSSNHEVQNCLLRSLLTRSKRDITPPLGSFRLHICFGSISSQSNGITRTISEVRQIRIASISLITVRDRTTHRTTAQGSQCPQLWIGEVAASSVTSKVTILDLNRQMLLQRSGHQSLIPFGDAGAISHRSEMSYIVTCKPSNA